MAWIHKESFDVIQELAEGLKREDFFGVDDLIALPVALLNEKGYETVESCAGHPFPVVTIADTYIELGKTISFDDLSSSIEISPGSKSIPFIHRTFSRRLTYIQFKEPLPYEIGIPLGWYYDSEENRLYTRYRMNGNVYNFTNEQLKKLDELMIWIEETPASTEIDVN